MAEGDGALVGWTSQDLGSRLVLKLESVSKPAPHRSEDIHAHFLLMDKTQALQLGHYLYEVIGQTSPTRRPNSWWARLVARRARRAAARCSVSSD